MALIQAFAGALGGVFADQWKDIITSDIFDEHTVVMPGVWRRTNNGRGSNVHGSDGVITNGTKIYVPDRTAAFVFDQGGVEAVITQPGGYEYRNGESTVFDYGGFASSVIQAVAHEVGERFSFGGQPPVTKRVAFVNLREVRGIRFGTPGPLVYHDMFYDTDLEVRARGVFSVRVTDAVSFVCNFLPANTGFYTFEDPRARSQIMSEFMQSFAVAVNELSDKYRISQLPGRSDEIVRHIVNNDVNAGSWNRRFGLDLVGVGIENIEFTPESRELVRLFSERRMELKAYEDVSARAGSMAAQQKIAQGVQENGLGDMGGVLFGMNMAQGIGVNAEVPSAVQSVRGAGAAAKFVPSVSEGDSSACEPISAVVALPLDEQIDVVKKLKELLDAGILTQSEFEQKKKDVMGL